jgi:hypothetical protein
MLQSLQVSNLARLATARQVMTLTSSACAVRVALGSRCEVMSLAKLALSTLAAGVLGS